MFRVGELVRNTRENESARIVKVHRNMGKETSTGEYQNAYTVDLFGKWKVWLEKTDFVTKHDLDGL